MKASTLAICKDLAKRYPELGVCEPAVVDAAQALIDCYHLGGKLMTCGNGGSASDSLHIVGELMKAFRLKRPLSQEKQTLLREHCPEFAQYYIDNLEEGLPAVALVSETATITAYMNDREPVLCFAQQLAGMGKKGDVLLAISTSGNSKNVIYAADVARALGIKVIGLLGRDGGKLKGLCDISIVVPYQETYQIQERHLPVYHTLCLAVENEFFGEQA